MTHTPGPWQAIPPEEEPDSWVIAQGSTNPNNYPFRIGSVYTLAFCAPRYTPDAEANARLIAAAPDLLEACRFGQWEAAEDGPRVLTSAAAIVFELGLVDLALVLRQKAQLERAAIAKAVDLLEGSTWALCVLEKR